MSLLFWLHCWPVGPVVSRLGVVGLCAILCSANVQIKLSVYCNVQGHLPSPEPVLLLLQLLLYFNYFNLRVYKTALFTQRSSLFLDVCICVGFGFAVSFIIASASLGTV